ncbi:MAG: CPBP family intramembrane metalloprotease [Anaerolineae bacterium]
MAGELNNQYSLTKILGLWAAAALPMALLSWVVIPALAPDFAANPLGSAVTRLVWMTAGLAWQFVLAMIMVYIEEGDLRWTTITGRLRLNTPRAPKTGEPGGRLWLWLIPFLLAVALVDVALGGVLVDLWVSVFPFFEAPPGFDAGEALGSPAVQVQLANAWWFLGLFGVFAVFNTFLGEELLFRGILLPRMRGAFGGWDWVANGLLFGFYHLSQPWGILSSCITGLLYAYPARRFRSTWMAVILHSAQSVFFVFLIFGIVLGLA